MTVHSFHLVRTALSTSVRALVRAPSAATVPRVRHADHLGEWDGRLDIIPTTSRA